jgi:hypothetical protein
MVDHNVLREQLLREAQTAPLRSWRIDASVWVIINLAMVGAVVTAVAHTDNGVGAALRWGCAVALLMLIVIGSGSAIRPGGRQWQTAMLGLAVLIVPLLVASSSWRTPTHGFFEDADCALAEAGISLLPVLVGAVVLRRFAFQARGAWVAGLAASATGLLALHFTCPVGELAHVIAFHAAPALLVAAALVWIRSRLSSSSFAP